MRLLQGAAVRGEGLQEAGLGCEPLQRVLALLRGQQPRHLVVVRVAAEDDLGLDVAGLLFLMLTVSPPSYFMEMLPSSLYTGRVLITPRLRAALVPFTSASSKVQMPVCCWQG